MQWKYVEYDELYSTSSKLSSLEKINSLQKWFNFPLFAWKDGLLGYYTRDVFVDIFNFVNVNQHLSLQGFVKSRK